MTYVVLCVDRAALSAGAYDAIADEAAAVNVDVDDLSAQVAMEQAGTVVVGVDLGALIEKVERRSGDRATATLWQLFRRSLTSRPVPVAVQDPQTKVAFVWDQLAIADSLVATDALRRVVRASAALPHGTQLGWDGAVRAWRPNQRGWPQNPGTVVVVAARPLEHEAFLGRLADARTETGPGGTRFDVGDVAGTGWRLALATDPVQTGPAISRFAPAAVLFVGLAGALRSDLRLGDVVVATQVRSVHDGPGGVAPRARTWATSTELLRIAHFVAVADSWWRTGSSRSVPPPAVRFGPVAAAEAVAEPRRASRADRIRQHYGDAIAVERERPGCGQPSPWDQLDRRVAALPIRGLGDHADGTKTAGDRGGSPVIAAHNAAAFGYAVVAELARVQPDGR